MKQGMSIPELYETVTEQAREKRDIVTDTTNLNLSLDATELQISEGRYSLTPSAHSQIATALDIPGRFYNRLRNDDADVLSHIVNEMFQRHSKKRMVRLLRNTARAFLSDRYRRIDNIDILSIVVQALPLIGTDAEIVSCNVSDDFFYLKVLFPKIEAELKVGDVFQAGMSIRNSEIGKASFSISSYLLRRVCSNGMNVEDVGFSQKHLGRKTEETDGRNIWSDETKKSDDETLKLMIRDSVKAAADDAVLKDSILKMGKAEDAKLIRPDKTIKELQQKHQITDAEGSLILDNLMHYASRDGLSAFGLSNAITETSKHIENYDRASEFERIGGKVMTDLDASWLLKG